MSEQEKPRLQAPVAVWQVLEGLKGQELTDWRMRVVKNEASREDRNLDKLPMPFGWFMLEYSEDLAVGEVKPLYYFGQDLVLWRGEDGKARLMLSLIHI